MFLAQTAVFAPILSALMNQLTTWVNPQEAAFFKYSRALACRMACIPLAFFVSLPLSYLAMATSPADFLNGADWAVILVYLGGIIALGIWFGKDQHNTRDYFLGSKDIPWWGIGLSIVAAETSALTIIGVPAMAYGTDMAFLQMIVGYVLARIILAIVMVPHYFKGEIYSPYPLFSNTFVPSVSQMA